MRPREHRYSQVSHDLDFMVIPWKLDVFGNCRSLSGRNLKFTEIGRKRGELGFIWRKDQAAKICSPKCPDSISSCCFWPSTNLLPLGGNYFHCSASALLPRHSPIYRAYTSNLKNHLVNSISLEKSCVYARQYQRSGIQNCNFLSYSHPISKRQRSCGCSCGFARHSMCLSKSKHCSLISETRPLFPHFTSHLHQILIWVTLAHR